MSDRMGTIDKDNKSLRINDYDRKGMSSGRADQVNSFRGAKV